MNGQVELEEYLQVRFQHKAFVSEIIILAIVFFSPDDVCHQVGLYLPLTIRCRR